MDLQRQLAAVYDQVGLDADRTRISGEQFRRFFGDAASVPRQIHRHHVFPTGTSLLPAVGLGIGTSLGFSVAHRRCLNPCSGFVDGLLDQRPLGVGESAMFTNKHHVSHAGADLRDPSHLSVGGDQQGQLVIDGHTERIDVDGGGISPPTGYRSAQQFRGRPTGSIGAGRCPGDLHGLSRGIVRGCGGQLAGGRESPGAIVQSTNPQAHRFIGGNGFHDTVAHDDTLLPVGNQPDVGVFRAPLPCGIQCCGYERIHHTGSNGSSEGGGNCSKALMLNASTE